MKVRHTGYPRSFLVEPSVYLPPALPLLGQRSLSGDQTLDQCLLAHARVALTHSLLIPARLDCWRLCRRCYDQRFVLLSGWTFPASALLGVRSGLQFCENGTF